MSDVRWYTALAAVLLAAPALATAQDAATLERRLRAIEVMRRSARVSVERIQRARREPLDTVQAGSLSVVIRPADTALTRRAAAIAWPKLDGLYGDYAALLAAKPMLFSLQGSSIRDASPEILRLERVTAAADATPDDAAFQLIRAASHAIREQTDSALANWLGPQLLPSAGPRVERARVYVELVTASSDVVRECFDGALDRCATALGIADGERLLSVEPPLSYDARQSFARMATAAGGRLGFARLARTRGQPMTQRLTVAAGQPLDSLLRRWRGDILAARPRPVALAAAIGWTALGWGVVFGLLALRTTRWR